MRCTALAIRADKTKKEGIDLSWLSLDETFWVGVMGLAEKHGMSSKDFLRRCVRHFDEYLESEAKPSRKYLTNEQKQHVKEAHSILTKRFWDKLTPEEKTARAQVAANARWAKKKDDEQPPGDGSETEG